MGSDSGAAADGMPVFVAYYAIGTLAEQEARRLLGSLERHGLGHHLEAIPDQGSWLANTGYKPRFVRECLERFADRALVYVDADTAVLQYPELFAGFGERTGCDLAVHSGREADRPLRVISDVIYLTNSPGCREAVEAWCVRQERHPEAWDEWNLEAVLAELGERVRVATLPAVYCQADTARTPGDAPVIVHYLGSPGRRRRRLRGTGSAAAEPQG
jgi:hypothetical protein